MDGVFVPGRRKRSKISRQEIIPAARPYAKTLRGPERPVDCGGTLSRFRRQGLVRARAAPRERNGGAGRWGRGRRPGEDIVREGPWRRETSKNGKKVKDEPKDSYRDIYYRGEPSKWTAIDPKTSTARRTGRCPWGTKTENGTVARAIWKDNQASQRDSDAMRRRKINTFIYSSKSTPIGGAVSRHGLRRRLVISRIDSRETKVPTIRLIGL